MMEEVGFADVSISYGRVAGDSRFINLIYRAQIRLVRGIKQP